MSEVDAIRIEFSGDTAVIMNICIAFLMFGVALDMKLDDFKRVVRYPKSVAVGLASQLLLLPLLTVLLITAWNPMASMALGLLLIAACPGGNVSNYAVHLSRGNTALSVTMTSIVTLSAMVVTPVSFALWSRFVPSTQPILESISVPPFAMVRIILQLIVLPLAAGMLVHYHLPRVTDRIKKPVKVISLLIFSSFIVFAVLTNSSNIAKYLHLVFVLVILHNVIALFAGYTFARINRLPGADVKAITMETGIQNAGLGLVLVLNFFQDLGGMMLVAAFWGVWDLLSSFALALWWNRRTVGVAVEQTQ